MIESIETYEDNEVIFNANGEYYLIVEIDNLKDIKNYEDETYYSYIKYNWGGYDQHRCYKIGEVVSVCKGADGKYIVVFKLVEKD